MQTFERSVYVYRVPAVDDYPPQDTASFLAFGGKHLSGISMENTPKKWCVALCQRTNVPEKGIKYGKKCSPKKDSARPPQKTDGGAVSADTCPSGTLYPTSDRTSADSGGQLFGGECGLCARLDYAGAGGQQLAAGIRRLWPNAAGVVRPADTGGRACPGVPKKLAELGSSWLRCAGHEKSAPFPI